MAALHFCANSQILLDGDFDGLALGTAPSVGAPAGAWFFPSDYVTGGLAETNAGEFVIMGFRGQQWLRLQAAASDLGNQHLVNLFTRPLYETPGGKVIVSFDILVDAGEFAGGSVYLANGGFSSITQRGPELRWSASGELTSVGADGDETALLLSYPRNVWQSVRLEVDLVTDTYNVYWAESGTSLQQIGTHLAFRSGSLSGLDRFTIARFSVDPVVRASVDNVSVEESLPEPLAILTDDGDFGFRSNQFGFNFAGPAGQTVAVEGSTNLLDWVALSTNTFGSVPLYFSDPDSGTLGRRFYRLRGVQ